MSGTTLSDAWLSDFENTRHQIETVLVSEIHYRTKLDDDAETVSALNFNDCVILR